MLFLTWIAAVCLVCAHAQYGNGIGSREIGRVSTRYNKNSGSQGAKLQDHQNRDVQQLDGVANRNAIWTGRAADRDNAFRRNEQQYRDQAANQRQRYGNDNKNFGNIVQQIRDEGLRNSYRINELARTSRRDQDQSNGFNSANARKNAFDRGNNLNDNISYRFNKVYNKQSSENGGFEDENGRNFRKVDLVDEKERDQALRRNDNAVSRRQNDQQQAIKELDWRAKANQAQAQAGQFGFADKRLEAAGERSDDRAVDYNRKDNAFRENERGVDAATRLAKDLAEQAAGYRNEATANADASKLAKDKKYYGGDQIGGKSVDAYGQVGAGGPSARNEGSGGLINTGFNENAAQRERQQEVARANALSAAQAANEYNRLKDRVVFDETKGLKDRAQGAFKQGLSDSANQGFSNNAAEAGKHASEKDRNFAGAASASNFAAQQKALNEALRDRDYVLKKQNDENETFVRRKQFYHNKREGGNNDERLNYDRNKKAREFGAAEEADLAKQNQFAKAKLDAKIANEGRTFEDTVNRRAQLQNLRDDRIQSAQGFGERQSQQAARAGADSSAFDRRQSKDNVDDSRSLEQQRKQALWDTAQASQSDDQDVRQHDKIVQANVDSITTGSQGPFGDIDSRDYVGNDVLQPQEINKNEQSYNIPDVIVDIRPVPAQVKVEPPKRPKPINELPPVQPVKAYQPPKYNKKEVDYTTHIGNPSRGRRRFETTGGFPGFQRNLFNRQNSFRDIGSRLLGNRNTATSAFRKPQGFSFSTRGRSGIGSLVRNPINGR